MIYCQILDDSSFVYLCYQPILFIKTYGDHMFFYEIAAFLHLLSKNSFFINRFLAVKRLV